MAAGIGWTRGVLDQAGLLGILDDLPAQLRLRLPSGAAVLGVHASPLADDGPGIEPAIPDEQLGRIRALNPGSAGLPRTSGTTHWLLLDRPPHRTAPDVIGGSDRLSCRPVGPGGFFSIVTGERQAVA